MTNPAQTVKRYRGRHVFDTLAARKFEGNIGSPYQGNTYYVDSSGSDGNNGRYSSNPLKTINAAIGKCSAENDDYIMVMDSWQEGATIELDKAGIHIIAMGNPYATWAALNVATDLHIFTVQATGAHGEIAGFTLGGGSTKAGIYLADCISMWIHNNTFGHGYAQDTPLYGIQAWNAGNPANALIEYNVFLGDGDSDGKISSNGIYVVQSASNSFTNSIIRNNLFTGLKGASEEGAILLDQCAGVKILDNYFLVTDQADGDAVNILATSTGCMVLKNHAIMGMLSNAFTFNPYRDLNTNELNGWGENYKGNQIVEPVGV